MGESDLDQALVERVQKGDKHAFDLLVRKYQHKLISVISRYVNDWSECQDVAQEAFVRNIGVDPDDEAIVRATISMAHNLNREVVAEGVEVEQHLDFLRAEGCEVLQGFLFCRPLPAPTFEALLQERGRLLGRVVTPGDAGVRRN